MSESNHDIFERYEELSAYCNRLECRVAELEAERRVLSAAVAAHNKARRSIRDWWTFGKGQFHQEHTHSWHTREDFIAMWDKELSKATKEATHPVI